MEKGAEEEIAVGRRKGRGQWSIEDEGKEEITIVRRGR